MKLRHLRVRHFRCIRALDWLVAGDFMCLVGPGDVGKSTVLDAIEFVLSPRWNLTFDDADFHAASHAEPIVIEATLGELHRRLQSDAHFGLRLRGLSADGTIHDEPEESDEPVITVRLAVDASLEPSWEVVTDRHPEGMSIHARERESFAAIRLGAVIDRQLSWSRGSSLARLTGDAEEHATMLADAGRSARASVDVERLPKLKAAAAQVAALSKVFGVRPRSEFGPGLDAANATLGTGGLALHDGLVPLRRAGLGTRRLVTLAIQREVSQSGGVLLIDEVENGLEPFRVRRLLRELRTRTPAAPASDERTSRVVVMTSHSAVALGELRAEELRIVRPSPDGIVLLTPPATAQGVMRTHAEAFLSEKVIVTEGRTELGLLRGLDEVWARTGESFAFRGVALADGGGCTKVSGVARVFLHLRYPTAVIADSDQPIDDPEDLPAALPDWRGFRKELEIRTALGKAAKSGDGWFKQVDRAAALGRIVAAHLGAAAGTDLATKLQSLKTWCTS